MESPAKNNQKSSDEPPEEKPVAESLPLASPNQKDPEKPTDVLKPTEDDLELASGEPIPKTQNSAAQKLADDEQASGSVKVREEMDTSVGNTSMEKEEKEHILAQPSTSAHLQDNRLPTPDNLGILAGTEATPSVGLCSEILKSPEEADTGENISMEVDKDDTITEGVKEELLAEPSTSTQLEGEDERPKPDQLDLLLEKETGPMDDAQPSTSTTHLEDDGLAEPDQLDLLAETAARPMDEEEDQTDDDDDLSDDGDSNEATEDVDTALNEDESFASFAFTISSVAGKNDMNKMSAKQLATVLEEGEIRDDIEGDKDDGEGSEESMLGEESGEESEEEGGSAGEGRKEKQKRNKLHKEIMLDDDPVMEEGDEDLGVSKEAGEEDEDEEFAFNLEDDREEDVPTLEGVLAEELTTLEGELAEELPTLEGVEATMLLAELGIEIKQEKPDKEVKKAVSEPEHSIQVSDVRIDDSVNEMEESGERMEGSEIQMNQPEIKTEPKTGIEEPTVIEKASEIIDKVPEIIKEAPKVVDAAFEIINEAFKMINDASETITEVPASETVNEATEIIQHAFEIGTEPVIRKDASEIIHEAPEIIHEAPEIMKETPEISTDTPAIIEDPAEVPEVEKNDDVEMSEIVEMQPAVVESAQQPDAEPEMTEITLLELAPMDVDKAVTPTASGPTEVADSQDGGKKASPKEGKSPLSSPSKIGKLKITKSSNVLDIVCLEESSSDSEVKIPESVETRIEKLSTIVDSLSEEIQIVSDNEEIRTESINKRNDEVNKDSEAVEAAPPETPNKEKTSILEKLLVKEASKMSKAHRFSLEVFNLDSDEEDSSKTSGKAQRPGPKSRKAALAAAAAAAAPTPQKSPKPSLRLSTEDMERLRSSAKCVNYRCSKENQELVLANGSVLSCYGIKRSKRSPYFVCQICYDKAMDRMERLMQGFRNSEPLISLKTFKDCVDIVEISDSDSDDDDTPCAYGEKLSEHNIKLIESELEPTINKLWQKFDLEQRLSDCKIGLDKHLTYLENRYKSIDTLLDLCQKRTDSIRNDLYESLKQPCEEARILQIVDTPWIKQSNEIGVLPKRQAASKQKNIQAAAAKEEKTSTRQSNSNTVNVEPMQIDDSISLVNMTVETPPDWLPPLGELVLKPLKVNDSVFALRGSTFGAWSKAWVLQIWPKGTMLSGCPSMFTLCRVKFESRLKGVGQKQLSGRQLAYSEPSTVRYPIGTRVVAQFSDPLNLVRGATFYSGIVAEKPTPTNRYRYLVFFDDGYASYVAHHEAYAVCETSGSVWDDVHPDSRDFVRSYLTSYPERPMVRLQPGQYLKTEWTGKWCMSRVIEVDCSLALVRFEEDDRKEWIYRGSTRLAPLFLELQAAGRKNRHRTTRMQLNKPNMPYVEYTRTEDHRSESHPEVPIDFQDLSRQPMPQNMPQNMQQHPQYQRAVARKSTADFTPSHPPQAPQQQRPVDNVLSRVVFYSPKTAVKPHKMNPHRCGVQCQRGDVIPLKDLRLYNPLAKPLLAGWERQIARFRSKKIVVYRAPCGRRLRDMGEIHTYLRAIKSDYTVDLFDFSPNVHCLAEFVINKPLVNKKDLSQGKENVPVPCVNYYDVSLPEFCVYNTERTPTAGVSLNLDPEFLCGCDCTDDCKDKSKCACSRMTLEGARTIGMEGDNVGYNYRRLLEAVPSGIYECNSRCKCAKTCLNRVAQHPLQLKLQVFKTLNRGWGIRALNDVPRGGFLCIYAGNLLTDDTANTDGKLEGDEYLAELDYIEVVERMKEGYESDVPEHSKSGGQGSKKAEAKDGQGEDEEDSTSEDEEEEERRERNSEQDVDFRPQDGVDLRRLTINPDARRKLRARKKDDKNKEAGSSLDLGPESSHFITISDDEEVREPSSFAAQANLSNDEYVPKYRSIRTFFGEDEDIYIMDAKVQGNIGRYLNHSCTPNVFVQNVFVDTHDPRFPWVAFFALTPIKAGTELTWNYNYDVGSVPGKVMYCKCGAPNCRGRLL